jgi:hypothetical protein
MGGVGVGSGLGSGGGDGASEIFSVMGLGRLVPLFAVVDVDLILSCFRHLVFSWCATFCYSGTSQCDDEILVNLSAERATQLRKVTKTSREWQMLTCVFFFMGDADLCW